MSKKRKSEIKERRVYFGTCHVDGKRYQTYKRARVKLEICAKHRRLGVSKDQIPMFNVVNPPGVLKVGYSED